VSTTWTRVGDAGAFSGSSWQKLYDAGATRLVVAFESATAIGASFPPSAEPFELVVGNQRMEAKPANPRPVAVSKAKAKPSMQADLGARIPINVPGAGPVRVAASFAGYRATWTIPESNLKPGMYAQILNAPKVPRVVAPQSKKSKSEVTDRDSHPAKRSAPAESLPQLTIRYRIEAADASGKDQPGVPGPGPQVRP
jgi:hypothetical protein